MTTLSAIQRGTLGLATTDSPTFAGLSIDTNAGVDGQWNTSGLTVYANGVTPQHDGPLHVMSGSAGTVTPDSTADEFIVEGSGSAGITVLTPDASWGGMIFGSPSNNAHAQLAAKQSTGQFLISTIGASGYLTFGVGAGSARGEWNTTGLTCFASGVTPQHDGVLHVMKGSAGTVTSTTALTVESNVGGDGITILTPDALGGYIVWASPSDATGAYISFTQSTAKMRIATDLAGGAIEFYPGNGATLALALDNSARMVALNTYSTTVGATNRDLYIDSTGIIGYVSSLRAAKTEIDPITDTSWLHALTPVSFKYRKKAEDGKSYTNEIDGDIQYGMIAEDVAAVRPDLCFYDDVADLDENGEKTETTHKELRGIQYSKLIPVLLKEVQKLRAELNQMKVN